MLRTGSASQAKCQVAAPFRQKHRKSYSQQQHAPGERAHMQHWLGMPRQTALGHCKSAIARKTCFSKLEAMSACSRVCYCAACLGKRVHYAQVALSRRTAARSNHFLLKHYFRAQVALARRATDCSNNLLLKHYRKEFLLQKALKT